MKAIVPQASVLRRLDPRRPSDAPWGAGLCVLACALACAKVHTGPAAEVQVRDSGAPAPDVRPPIPDASRDFGQGVKIDAADAAPMVGDPTTCDEAAKDRTYVGCD